MPTSASIRTIGLTQAGRDYLARHRAERVDIPPCDWCGLRHTHPIEVGIVGPYLVRCEGAS